MKRIFCACSVLMLTLAAAFAQDDQFTPMKGTATPEFQMSDTHGRCLVFGRHIVKTTDSEDGGENVRMWMREGNAKGAQACQLRSKPYAEIKDSDNNSFYGISAVYTFIDTGTSAGSRSLLVFKTDSGDEVTTVDYFYTSSEPRIESARYLFYDALSTRKGVISTCKDAAKWKHQGGGVAWVQSKQMDLDTQKTTNIGPLRCAYQE